MNNEPVAWMKMDEVFKHFDSVGCGTIYKTGGEGRVPVYTHPADLTDEEILSLWMQKNTLGGAQNIVDFARAILKKASKK
jgi:hypothetical protein